MDDMVNEELQIMGESNEEVMSLSSTTFELPISTLKLSPPVCVRETTLTKEVCALMQAKKIGSVLVVSELNEVVGIFTERDLLFRIAGKVRDWETKPVQKFMTFEPLTLQASDMIAYAMNNMHVGGYRHIPIVDETNQPIGVLSIKDITSFILDQFPKHILNITGQPFRGISQRESA
ncbi:MAG: hypothetical protein A2X86_03895 [Bdellovibrionales bacterium GWA2_49_15]|nr:MAG: hypothetical protein A2X86_03895 [Bdellovibrionales bacterium GWA2_49_15]